MAGLVDRSPHQSLYVASSIENATAAIQHAIPAIEDVESSFLQPKVIIGFFVLLMILQARIFGVGKKKLPPGVKPLPRLPGLPYAGRFWDVPGPGIEAAWHFGGLHKKMGPIYEWKVTRSNCAIVRPRADIPPGDGYHPYLGRD